MHPSSFFSVFIQLQLPLLAIHPVVSLPMPQFTWTGPLSLHAQLDPATSDTIILQHANTVPGVVVTCLFQGIFMKEINGSAVISGCRASPVVHVTIISRYLRGRTMFEIRGNLTQEVVSAYSGDQNVENDEEVSRFRRSIFPGDVMAQYDYLDYSDPLPTDLVLKMKFAYDESFKRHLGSDAAARKYIAEVVTHGKEYFKEESLGTNIFLDIQGPPQLLPNKELDISGPSFVEVQEVKAEEPIPLSVFCYTDDQDSLMGVSKRGKACDANLGISLTKWRCNVLKAAQTFAHESGHMDGFFHDSWEDAVNAANGITTSCEGNGLMSDDTPFEDRPNAWSICTSQRFEKWYRKFGKECISEVLPCSEESGSWRTPCKCGSGPAPSLCVAGHTCCQHQTATCLGEPSDIVKLYAIIQSMKLEMESLRQNIGQNTVGITKNTEGITKNTEGINKNTEGITTSNAGIKKHNADISKNSVRITTNTAGITKNTYSITKNTEGISKNTGGITTNTGGITKNTEGITKNNEGITKNTEGITKNTAGITKNTEGITKNTGGITKNTEGITTNTAAFATKCDIATCSDIQTMATKLESCLADASSADCPPSANGKIGITAIQKLSLHKECINGMATLNMMIEGRLVEVSCENSGDGNNAWTVIQRRGQYGNPEDHFSRVWTEYENGFGSPQDEVWLGLRNMAAMTKEGEWELQVDMEDWTGIKYMALYKKFSVGPGQRYELHISDFDTSKSTLAESNLNYHNGKPFSTKDKDRDGHPGLHCAQSLNEGGGGGWWWHQCGWGLNGLNFNGQKSSSAGICWYYGAQRGNGWKTWKGSVMKIRRVNL